MLGKHSKKPSHAHPEESDARTAAPTPSDKSPTQAAQVDEAAAVAEAADAAALDALRGELDSLKDRELRAIAELENYRKRISRQIDEERRYAQMPLMRDLLPVLDNLRRAIEASEKSPEAGGLLDGVKMVVAQFRAVLEKHHCVPIAALGEPFDPNFHEAILQQPSAEHPPSTVIMETQSGFRLHDRVVRPSQVIVSSAAPAAEPGQGS